MGAKYIEKAKHCIGLDSNRTYVRHGKKYYRPYRNFYATGCQDNDWDMMVAAGYAGRGEKNSHGGYTFSLTREGLDWIGKKLGIHVYDEED